MKEWDKLTRNTEDKIKGGEEYSLWCSRIGGVIMTVSHTNYLSSPA